MNHFIYNHLYKNLLLIHAYSCHCVTTNLNKGKNIENVYLFLNMTNTHKLFLQNQQFIIFHFSF